MAEKRMYRIKTVSDLTDITAVTLRAWENRYGLFNPERTESGHRLYSEADLRKAQIIKGYINQGLQISEAIRRFNAEYPGGMEGAELPEGQEPITWVRERFIGEFMRLVDNWDQDAIASLVEQYLEGRSIQEVVSQLLAPALKKLGEEWFSGRAAVAQEHFVSHFLQQYLGRRDPYRPLHNQEAVILGCPPGEQHQIGLIGLALVLKAKGTQVHYLGADVTTRQFVSAIQDLRCHKIAIYISEDELDEGHINHFLDHLRPYKPRILVTGEGKEAFRPYADGERVRVLEDDEADHSRLFPMNRLRRLA